MQQYLRSWKKPSGHSAGTQCRLLHRRLPLTSPLCLLALSLAQPACSGSNEQPGSIVFGLDWEEEWKGDSYFLRHGSNTDTVCDDEADEMLAIYHSYQRYLGVPRIETPATFFARFPNDSSMHPQLEQACGAGSKGCVWEGHLFAATGAVTHELAHLAAAELSSSSGLFSEGLATAISCSPFNGLYSPPWAAWSENAEALRNIEITEDNRYYYWAGRFVTFLLVTEGVERFTRFFATTDGQEDPRVVAELFHEAYGEPVEHAWEKMRAPEYAQACIPVAQCQKDLTSEDKGCHDIMPGGKLPMEELHKVEVSGDFGVYTCNGLGAEVQVPRLEDKQAWLYGEEPYVLALWSNLGVGRARLLSSERRAQAPCADLSLEVHLGVDDHFVFMPPIDEFVLDVTINGDMNGTFFDFEWGSTESIGYEGGQLSLTAPLWVRQFADCETLADGQARQNWPVGEGGLFQLESRLSGPYIFEFESLSQR